jgi:hypothetical protein
MEGKKNYDEQLEKVMNQLADSVLELSEEAILNEISEAGADPQREAERVRVALQKHLQTFDAVDKRLANLGHAINSKSWWRGERRYHNKCIKCGSLVSFSTTTNEMQGEASDRACPESERYATRRLYGNLSR